MKVMSMCSALALGVFAATSSSASVIINVSETAAGIEIDYFGSIDLTDALLDNSFLSAPQTYLGENFGHPFFAALNGAYDLYTISSITDTYVGDAHTVTNDILSGDMFGAYTSTSTGVIAVNSGYSSGSEIAGNVTMAGATFDSYGIREGSFMMTLANDDTVSFNFGESFLQGISSNAAAVPLPASLPLILAGLGGLGLLRRRKKA